MYPIAPDSRLCLLKPRKPVPWSARQPQSRPYIALASQGSRPSIRDEMRSWAAFWLQRRQQRLPLAGRHVRPGASGPVHFALSLQSVPRRPPERRRLGDLSCRAGSLLPFPRPSQPRSPRRPAPQLPGLYRPGLPGRTHPARSQQGRAPRPLLWLVLAPSARHSRQKSPLSLRERGRG